MDRLIEYNGYHAKVAFDAEDMLFVGEVFGIQDSLNFHGASVTELVENFHQSIDNYLKMCDALGKRPDKEFKGSFNVRIDPSLHREAAFAAEQSGITLNQYVENAIRSAVSKIEYGPTYIFLPSLQSAPIQSLFAEKAFENSLNYTPTAKQYDYSNTMGA